jgi:hypothetical protein
MLGCSSLDPNHPRELVIFWKEIAGSTLENHIYATTILRLVYVDQNF